MKQHTAYSIARFDGALLYQNIKAGLLRTGITKSPIVFFKVRAGAQLHPVWALDELAYEIFVYCETAKLAKVSDTHLQVSVTASWISGELFSNLVANHVEWHIASNSLRVDAQRIYIELKKGKGLSWPEEEIRLPVADDF